MLMLAGRNDLLVQGKVRTEDMLYQTTASYLLRRHRQAFFFGSYLDAAVTADREQAMRNALAPSVAISVLEHASSSAIWR